MKSIFEQMGGTYHQEEDYLIPDLSIPEAVPIGVWGQRHLRYLKEYRKGTYSNMLLNGKLNGYLADIDRQAEAMYSLMVKQMAEREGITEQLKADQPLEWTGRMNNISSWAAEIVNADLIFA